MKKFLIGMVLDAVWEYLLVQLMLMAGRSNNTVDDELVAVLRGNRQAILDGIRANL